MANENNSSPFDIEEMSKRAERVQDVLKKMEDAKIEFAEFGMNLNENITTDSSKWAAYWGL